MNLLKKLYVLIFFSLVSQAGQAIPLCPERGLYAKTYNEDDSVFLEPEENKEGDAHEVNSESRGLNSGHSILGHQDIIGDAPPNKDNISQIDSIEKNASEKDLPNDSAIPENQDDLSSQHFSSEDGSEKNSRENLPHYPIPVPVQTRPWLFKSNSQQSSAILHPQNTSQSFKTVIHHHTVLKNSSSSHEQVWYTKKQKGFKGIARKFKNLFRFKKHKNND